MLNCVVCGERLPVWFKGECCPGDSSKCRKKKSRDRIQARPDARIILNTIWSSLDKMIDQVRGLEAKEEAAKGE